VIVVCHITTVLKLSNAAIHFLGGDPNAGTSENKEEMDARSVFVGNVGFLSIFMYIKKTIIQVIV
jgi:hypothetical protein